MSVNKIIVALVAAASAGYGEDSMTVCDALHRLSELDGTTVAVHGVIALSEIAIPSKPRYEGNERGVPVTFIAQSLRASPACTSAIQWSGYEWPHYISLAADPGLSFERNRAIVEEYNAFRDKNSGTLVRVAATVYGRYFVQHKPRSRQRLIEGDSGGRYFVAGIRFTNIDHWELVTITQVEYEWIEKHDRPLAVRIKPRR